MKFDAVEEGQWAQWGAYVDTVLVPWTQLRGCELPWEMHARLVALRDCMAPIERDFSGRVLTIPAVHYGVGEEGWQRVCAIGRACRARGAAFVVVVAVAMQGVCGTDDVDLFVSVDGAYVGTGDGWTLWRGARHPLCTIWNASIV